MDPKTASPSWSPVQRALFRFAFCYLVVYTLPFPLHRIPWAGEIITQPYKDLWNWLVPWAGKYLLGLDITVRSGGSGDMAYNYVQVLCFLILALVVTGVWTALDRKRPGYTRLDEGLRVYIRFALAAAMLSYGAYKVIPSQFAKPFPAELIEPFGEASPMGLLWTFMGASSGYTIFTGAAEMIAGLLLAFRRTALLVRTSATSSASRHTVTHISSGDRGRRPLRAQARSPGFQSGVAEAPSIPEPLQGPRRE